MGCAHANRVGDAMNQKEIRRILKGYGVLKITNGVRLHSARLNSTDNPGVSVLMRTDTNSNAAIKKLYRALYDRVWIMCGVTL